MGKKSQGGAALKANQKRTPGGGEEKTVSKEGKLNSPGRSTNRGLRPPGPNKRRVEKNFVSPFALK